MKIRRYKAGASPAGACDAVRDGVEPGAADDAAVAGSDGADGAMASGGREWRLPRRGQKGFTIVEVLVALLILLMVGTVAAQFAVRAIHTSYEQQQRVTATTLATSGMEKVRSRIRGVSGSSYLASITAGMSQSDAEAAYAAAKDLGVVSDGDFQLAYSTTSTVPGGTATIAPVDASNTVNGTPFTVYTVVGKCYRKNTSAQCLAVDPAAFSSPEYLASGVASGGSSSSSSSDVKLTDASLPDLTTALSDPTVQADYPFKAGADVYTPMLRVTVVVSWTYGSSPSTPQVYATTEYLDCCGETAMNNSGAWTL